MSVVLSCAQFAPSAGDVPANVRTMVDLANDAATMGAGVIVFPELAVTGYLTPEEMASLAMPLDAPALEPLREAARGHRLTIVFGVPESTADATFNSMACLGPDGALAHIYRKLHLWDTERIWASPGAEARAVKLAGLRAGCWNCYDTRFPELARELALQGATLGLVSTAWLGPPAEWELALRARALDNGMYVVGAALQGTHQNLHFGGDSLIVDPHGNVLSRVPQGREGVAVATYNPAVVAEFRGRLPLLHNRRIDLWKRAPQPAGW